MRYLPAEEFLQTKCIKIPWNAVWVAPIGRQGQAKFDTGAIYHRKQHPAGKNEPGVSQGETHGCFQLDSKFTGDWSYTLAQQHQTNVADVFSRLTSHTDCRALSLLQWTIQWWGWEATGIHISKYSGKKWGAKGYNRVSPTDGTGMVLVHTGTI